VLNLIIQEITLVSAAIIPMFTQVKTGQKLPLIMITLISLPQLNLERTVKILSQLLWTDQWKYIHNKYFNDPIIVEII